MKRSSAENDLDIRAGEGDTSRVSESRASKNISRATIAEGSNDTEGMTRQATFPSAPLVSTTVGPILGPGKGRYYLFFVNSPVASLVNSRLQLDFEESSTVAIGRDSGNAIVVPDQAVSRFHAELAMEDGRIFLRDLKSTNGTFLYKGTDFQRVQGSVLISPNSAIRLGTHTILRLMRE